MGRWRPGNRADKGLIVGIFGKKSLKWDEELLIDEFSDLIRGF